MLLQIALTPNELAHFQMELVFSGQKAIPFSVIRPRLEGRLTYKEGDVLGVQELWAKLPIGKLAYFCDLDSKTKLLARNFSLQPLRPAHLMPSSMVRFWVTITQVEPVERSNVGAEEFFDMGSGNVVSAPASVFSRVWQERSVDFGWRCTPLWRVRGKFSDDKSVLALAPRFVQREQLGLI